MIALLTVTLMIAAALGAGTALIRCAAGPDGPASGERLALGFALGVGVLGWLAFFPVLGQHVEKPMLAAIAAVCLLGWRYALPAVRGLRPIIPDGWGKILLLAIAVVLAFDLMEAVAPPADADSLAYHFALPKHFLAAGGLYPIYRAGDGMTPLLQHMTYLMALGLGGERALTLWTTVSGWGLGAVAFVVARRHMSLNGALAVAFLVLTTPAVIYGAGTGQVEARNAMFVLVAALFAAEAVATGRPGPAALAGLAAGFFLGSKYTGLLFVFACGLAVLMQRRWFRAGAVFAVASLAAGWQWYAWSWWATGDPLFPSLYGILPSPDRVGWNDAVAAAYQYMRVDRVVPVDLYWLFAYPIKATFDPFRHFEAGRVGFGPALFLLAPFASITAWRHRRRIVASPLALYAAMAVIVYGLWFFLGPSLRVRHLLPIYPLTLIVAMAAAERAAADMAAARAPFVAVLAVVGVVQFGAHALFSLNYFDRLAKGETRDEFLRRNVAIYDVVPWINRTLKPSDRLLMITRQLNYLIEPPVFYGMASTQGLVEMHKNAKSVGRFWKQIRAQGITHALVGPIDTETEPLDQLESLVNRLWKSGCVTVVKNMDIRYLGSRTLGLRREKPRHVQVVAFHDTCALKGEGN